MRARAGGFVVWNIFTCARLCKKLECPVWLSILSDWVSCLMEYPVWLSILSDWTSCLILPCDTHVLRITCTFSPGGINPHVPVCVHVCEVRRKAAQAKITKANLWPLNKSPRSKRKAFCELNMHMVMSTLYSIVVLNICWILSYQNGSLRRVHTSHKRTDTHACTY